jgi:peptidoglycan hydrolase CwlO-like protein
MKTMRTLLLLICGVGVFAICFSVMGQQEVQAPTKRSPAAAGQKRQVSSSERSKKMIETRLTRLDKYLKLTPGQKKDIRNLMEKSQPDMQKLQDQMKQIQEQIRKIMTRTEEEIKALLTAEQKKKYEILQEISPRGGGQGGEMGGPGGEMGGPEEEMEVVE